MIVVINYVAHNEAIALYFQQMNDDNKAEIIKQIIFRTIDITFYAEIIISALMLFGVYRKIKTQKY